MTGPTNAGSISRLSRPRNCFNSPGNGEGSRTALRRAFIACQKAGMAVDWICPPGANMLVEIAKPVTLVFCILSLYAVFDAAFLSLSIDLHEKIYESLLRIALAALISVMSG